MSKTKSLLIIFIFGLVVSLVFPTVENEVYAGTKNEVTLNFVNGIIHDGYVEYSNIGKLQLFKGDELVTNIDNGMKIDLNEADYQFVIEEIQIEDTGSVVGPAPVKLNINNWYYATTTKANTRITFKLESSKFTDKTLNIKLVRERTVINTRVENVYDNISSTATIDLSNEYVIDSSKNDELTNSLKLFADLEKTLYYKNQNGSLVRTENEDDAVIKIVGKKSENVAIMTAINVKDKRSENFKGVYTVYTGSKLQFDGSIENIINETRTDYYTVCNYNFTFNYSNAQKEYQFIEGANQVYTIDKSKNAVFKVNTTAKDIKEIYIDGSILDAKNYVLDSQDGIITILDEYLKNLAIGEHKIKVTFLDEKEIETNFEVKAEQSQSDIKDEEKNESIENTDPNPETGDNVLTNLTISVISILGVAIALMINNKKIKED